MSVCVERTQFLCPSADQVRTELLCPSADRIAVTCTMLGVRVVTEHRVFTESGSPGADCLRLCVADGWCANHARAD
jgi:hypothetical protein